MGRERDVSRATQLGHVGEGGDRLLDVRDLEGLEQGERPSSSVEAPAHVRVQPQGAVRADRRSDFPREPNVVVEGTNRDLPLEHRRAVLLAHPFAEGCNVRRRLLGSRSVGEVLAERDLGAMQAAEQLVQRNRGFARGDVPERDLDTRERVLDENPAVAAVLRPSSGTLPDPGT